MGYYIIQVRYKRHLDTVNIERTSKEDLSLFCRCWGWYYLGKALPCSTERKKTKRELREVAIIGASADESVDCGTSTHGNRKIVVFFNILISCIQVSNITIHIVQYISYFSCLQGSNALDVIFFVVIKNAFLLFPKLCPFL
jgi:hypothetical protein